MAALEDLEARIAAMEAAHADYRAVLGAVNALGPTSGTSPTDNGNFERRDASTGFPRSAVTHGAEIAKAPVRQAIKLE